MLWNQKNKSGVCVKTKSHDEVIRVEDNHPALVNKKSFSKVEEFLKNRSPKIPHPRTTNSKYLLSGLLFCAGCEPSMVGSAAKSLQHFYYACQNYSTREQICSAKMVNRAKIEKF